MFGRMQSISIDWVISMLSFFFKEFLEFIPNVGNIK